MAGKKSKKRAGNAVTKRIVSDTTPTCSVCSKKIKVLSNGGVVDGYYFGEIPLYRKSELDKMRRSGIRKSKIGPIRIDVYKYDPKPYAHRPYWECLPCYREQRGRLRKSPARR